MQLNPISSECFKPLHSGAGFLCKSIRFVLDRWTCVSNPFIAGRDSSEGHGEEVAIGLITFQTPS